MKSVLFNFEPNSVWAEHIERLRGAYPKTRFVASAKPTTADLEAATVLVAYSADAELFEAMKALQAVVVPMAGVNQFPFELFRERGIALTNAHFNGRYVAERAVALLLAWFGKVVYFHNELSRGVWHGFAISEPIQESWHSICGKTVAVIGTGSIGEAVGRLLLPFGVRLIGVKRDIPEVGRDYPPFERITNDMLSAAAEADIAVVTLPLTDETRGIVGAEFFRTFRRGMVVNVGRGEVIDEESFFNALKDGTLAGAAIDTWYTYPKKGEAECYPSRFPFHELPNVVLSPHVGGYTAQATLGSIADAVASVRGFLETGRFEREVDLTLGY